ncbi:YrhC family protein [Bacillus sp. 1A]|uniref:YrhC family protein n=1 Tax=Bacillus sp. 1A TaxID=3461399 RepID=UPI0040443BDD
MKELQGKIKDYTRFGQILLAVSTLLMVGLLIPNGAKEAIQSFVMMGSTVIFLSLSFFFFQRVKMMREQLEGNECE